MGNTERTKTVGARVSQDQLEVLRTFLGDKRDSDYIRRLIAEDLQRHGIEWPDYEFVDNDQRRGRPIDWIDYNAR